MKHMDKKCFIALIVALAIAALCSRAAAVTRFGSVVQEKKPPARFTFDDIWFYDGAKK